MPQGALRKSLGEQMNAKPASGLVLSQADATFVRQMLNYTRNVGNHLGKVLEFNPEWLKGSESDPRRKLSCTWKLSQYAYENMGDIVKFALAQASQREQSDDVKSDFLSLLSWSKRRSDFYYFMRDDPENGSVLMSSDKKSLFYVKTPYPMSLGKILARQIGYPDDIEAPDYPVKLYTTLLPFDDNIVFDLLFIINVSELQITDQECLDRRKELQTLALTMTPSHSLSNSPHIEVTLYRDEYVFAEDGKQGAEDILCVVDYKKVKSNPRWHEDRVSQLRPKPPENSGQHGHGHEPQRQPQQQQHGHSHNGMPCHGHGPQQQQHGHSHNGMPCHGHGPQQHGHSHDGEHNHNHSHGGNHNHSHGPQKMKGRASAPKVTKKNKTKAPSRATME